MYEIMNHILRFFTFDENSNMIKEYIKGKALHVPYGATFHISCEAMADAYDAMNPNLIIYKL